MAQVPRSGRLVVGLEALLARPVANGVADRVPELGREQADVDRDDLVPAPGAVESERHAVVARGERVLELVAVVVERGRGQDRLDQRLRDPSDPRERVAHLLLLRRDLLLVGEVLEPAASADAEVRAWRFHAVRARLENGAGGSLGETALDLRHLRAHAVAR